MSQINAVVKVKEVFIRKARPLTLTEIRTELPELLPSAISMALCYFVRQEFATREKIANPSPKLRKTIWRYTFIDRPLKRQPPRISAENAETTLG